MLTQQARFCLASLSPETSVKKPNGSAKEKVWQVAPASAHLLKSDEQPVSRTSIETYVRFAGSQNLCPRDRQISQRLQRTKRLDGTTGARIARTSKIENTFDAFLQRNSQRGGEYHHSIKGGTDTSSATSFAHLATPPDKCRCAKHKRVFDAKPGAPPVADATLTLVRQARNVVNAFSEQSVSATRDFRGSTDTSSATSFARLATLPDKCRCAKHKRVFDAKP